MAYSVVLDKVAEGPVNLLFEGVKDIGHVFARDSGAKSIVSITVSDRDLLL